MWIPSKVVRCSNDLHSSVSSNLTAYDKLKEDVGSGFLFFFLFGGDSECFGIFWFLYETIGRPYFETDKNNCYFL